jgi:hypothetical protein
LDVTKKTKNAHQAAREKEAVEGRKVSVGLAVIEAKRVVAVLRALQVRQEQQGF